MAKKQVIVRVHKDGSVDAETVGMAGAECLDYFAALEDLLDAKTVRSAYTDDYHRVPDEQGQAVGTPGSVREGGA